MLGCLLRIKILSPRLCERVLCSLVERIECVFLIALLGFYPRPQQDAVLHLRRAVGPLDTHFAIEVATFFDIFRVGIECG